MITVRNKTSCFICTIVIDYSAKLHFSFGIFDKFSLICDNSNRPTFDTCIGRNKCFAIIRFVFFKFGIINQTFDDFIHVILICPRFRKDSIQFFRVFFWFYCGDFTEPCFVKISYFINNRFYFIKRI